MANKNVPFFGSGGIPREYGVVGDDYLIPVWTPNGLWGAAAPSQIPSGAVYLAKTKVSAEAQRISRSIDAIQTEGYATVGDGGSALYKRVASQPAHGAAFRTRDGAWWELAETNVNLKMLGAVDSNVDCASSITVFNQYIAYSISKFAEPTNDNFQLVQSQITASLCGEFLYSNEMIIWPGCTYDFPAGSRLIAGANGQTMVRTPTTAELTAALGSPTYGARAISFSGGGTIDGNNKASIGFLGDTVAYNGEGSFIVTRCTYSRYSTTCTGTAASAVVTLPSASSVRPLDTVYIEDSVSKFFTVVSKSGNNVTLNAALGTDLTDTPIVHRACGLSANDMQQCQLNVFALFNDIGWAFGPNRENIQCTDMKMRGGLSTWNYVGDLNIIGDVRRTDCTVQHNFTYEIVHVRGTGGVYTNLYIERMGDSQANTVVPPGGGSPVGVAALHANPLVLLIGGKVEFHSVNYPTNSGSTSWSRFCINSAETVIRDVTINDALVVNPSIAGDYGLVEQSQSQGSVRLEGVIGPSNINTAGPSLVVRPNGTAPGESTASWFWYTGGRVREARGSGRWYSWLTSSILDIFRIGETQPRLSLTPGSVVFGNGTIAPDVTLARGFAGSLAIGGNYVGTRVSVPATATSAGLPGYFASDANFYYTYIGDGTTHSWRRVAVAAW